MPDSTAAEERIRWKQLCSPVGVLVALAVLFVSLAPSINVLPDVGLYNSKRLLQVALLVGLGLWLVVSGQARRQVARVLGELPAAAQWGIATVFVFGGVSSFFAPLPHYAFVELVHFGLLFAAAAAVAAAARQVPGKAGRLVVGTAVFGTFLYAVTFLVGYVGHVAGGAFLLWPEASLGFANIRHFNHYQTWTLPLVAAAPLLLPARMKGSRGVLYGLLALWWTLLLASGGRGVLIAAAVATGGAALLFGKAAWPWLRAQIAGSILGGLLFWLLFKGLANSQSSVLGRELSEGGQRPQAWLEALEASFQSFPLGAGPMHYAHYPSANTWAHPHSAILQWAAEWGVIAAVIVVVLSVWGLWTWVRQNRRMLAEADSMKQSLFVAVTAALLAGSAHSFVSGLIVSPLSQVLAAVIVGLTWGLYVSEKETGNKPTSNAQDVPTYTHRILQASLSCALFVLIWGIHKDVAVLEKRPIAYYEESGSLLMSPRYWQQGYFGTDLATEDVKTKVLPLGAVGSE